MANRTKVASISASVQRARVNFGEPCNKRAFILTIHLLSVFWRTIKGSYASMLHKVWTVSRAQDCLLHALTVQALFWKTGEPLVEFPYYLHVFVWTLISAGGSLYGLLFGSPFRSLVWTKL
jgi:hypothetical protein